MILKELTSKIEEQIPLGYAEEWDNVGLLVGDDSADIKKVYIALDATDQVLQHAREAEADLLLTHHPMIFSGMKQVLASDFIGRRVMALAKADMSYYAMHTNFDVAVMGRLAAERLEMKDFEPLDFSGFLEGEGADAIPLGIGAHGALGEYITVRAMAQRVKEAFGLANVRVFGNPDNLCDHVAILPGSGKSYINHAIAEGANVFITGDVDHHTGIDAYARGLSIIDAGHYGIEHIFIEYMEDFLHELVPELTVLTEPKEEPFMMV